MLNGEFAVDQARRIAGKILTRSTDPKRIAVACYRRVLGREPDTEELAAAEGFLRDQERLIAAEGPVEATTLPDPRPATVRPALAAAVVDLAHALLNTTEFLYVE
jgi:hypothetical protein